jgi:hypothetical protein
MQFPAGPGAGGPQPLQNSFRQQAAPRQSKNSSQSRGPGDSPIMFNMPSNLQDQTVRMIVHTSLGGRRVRVNFSNAQGKPLVQIGSAHIAIHKEDGAIVAGTDRTITFNGKSSLLMECLRACCFQVHSWSAIQ